MPLHPAPFRPAAALIALAMLAGAASAAVPSRPASAVGDEAGQAVALAAAQDRAARAAATVDDLKRELSPGHLNDPMPGTDLTFGLAGLRADYAEAQRRAAGYRATLGDRHPTLLATEVTMDDIRAQLLDGTRKALASAERDAAAARADVAAAERRLSAPPPRAVPAPPPRAVPAPARAAEPRISDVTGSVAAPPSPSATRGSSPLPLPPSAAPARSAPSAAAQSVPAARRPSSVLLMVLAAAALAALLAAWAALRLLRPAARPAPARAVAVARVEPALARAVVGGPAAALPAAPEPALDPVPRDEASVPVLQRLTLAGVTDVRAETSGDPATAALHATLRAAFGDAGRMNVLVSPAAGLPVPKADAAAFALAQAVAQAGRRPLLMEARATGRLRGACVPSRAVPRLIEAGGTSRTLYRVGPEDAAVSVLPSDAGEAEAARAADARPGVERLRGLDAFDTVILVGDDAAALAASADLVLLAAPAGATPAALAAAAVAFGAARHRCGVVLVAAPAPADAPPVPAIRPAAPPRRCPAEPLQAARLGLRGSIEPQRRRVAG